MAAIAAFLAAAGKAIAVNPAARQTVVVIGNGAFWWLCECAAAAEQQKALEGVSHG